MQTPFQIDKTFTTRLFPQQIVDIINEKLNSRIQLPLMSFAAYLGKVNGNSFIFYETNAKWGTRGPTISGTILSIQPTTIQIKISPNYLRVFIALPVAVIVVFAGISLTDVTMNGITRTAVLSDRIITVLLGIVIPGFLFYIDCILSVKQAEYAIKEALTLREC